MKRLVDLVRDNAWTYAGTGLVLITLSGTTLRQAIWLVGICLIVHGILTVSNGDN